MSEFAAVKPMKSESFSELKRLIKETSAPFSFLASLEQPTESWSTLLVFFTVSRFNPNTWKDWEKHLGESVKTPTWKQLQSFINSQFLTLEAMEQGVKSLTTNFAKSSTPNQKPSKGCSQSAVHSVQSSSKARSKVGTPACTLCKQPHYIGSCELFKSKSLSDKKDFVSRERLCYNCWGKQAVQACRSFRCCLSCKGKHHTLLHSTPHRKQICPLI